MKVRRFFRRLLTRHRLILLGVAVAVTIVLMVFLRDVVRYIFVVPVLYLVWLVGILFETIPQLLLWILFVLIALRLAVGSLLVRWKEPADKTRKEKAEHWGQARIWAKWIELAAKGEFSKWRLAQHLTQLAVETLAHRERLTFEQVIQQLRTGGLEMPPEIRAYLLTALEPVPTSRFAELKSRFGSRELFPPLQLNPEKVVRFIEVQLGVRHGE